MSIEELAQYLSSKSPGLQTQNGLSIHDEVNEHLTLPEDFINYFFDNQNKLQVAIANRFRY